MKDSIAGWGIVCCAVVSILGICTLIEVRYPSKTQAQVPAQGLNTKRFMLTNLQNMSVSTTTGNVHLEIVVIQDSITGREFLRVGSGNLVEIGGKR